MQVPVVLMPHDPELPEWVRARLRSASRRKPRCTYGSTHHICHCLQKRLIEAEEELAWHRMKRHERTVALLESGKDAKMRVFGNSMLPLIKTKSVVVYRPTNDYQVGDVVFVKIGGNYLTHKITKIDSKGRYMIANNKGRENGWASKIYGRVIAVNDEPFGRPVTSSQARAQT